MKIHDWCKHPASAQLIIPILLYILIYFISPYFPHLKINVAAPYLFEKSIFHISLLDQPFTINEWWQYHRSPALDAFASLSYISFFFIFVLIAIYFYSKSWQHSNAKAFSIGWSLFWLGIAYFITSHLYPVAPPWYVTQYGLSESMINLQVHANAISCDNFDASIGYKLCAKYVGSGPYPFGAMPSMHVGIPLLLVYYAFKYKKLKGLCILFYFVEVFSTLYLNQHYLIDLIVGSLYAVIIAVMVDGYHAWRASGEARTFSNNSIPSRINTGTTINPNA